VTESNLPVVGPAKNTNQVRRRLWWGLGFLTVLLFAASGALIFETITGGISGTVLEVRIDECTSAKLRMTVFRRSESNFTLTNEGMAEGAAPVEKPQHAVPLISDLRQRFWETTFGPSHSFALDKPGSVVSQVKAGDVIRLRLNEKVALFGWETNRTSQRWVIVAEAKK
jgi:hypothetical protein